MCEEDDGDASQTCVTRSNFESWEKGESSVWVRPATPDGRNTNIHDEAGKCNYCDYGWCFNCAGNKIATNCLQPKLSDCKDRPKNGAPTPDPFCACGGDANPPSPWPPSTYVVECQFPRKTKKPVPPPPSPSAICAYWPSVGYVDKYPGWLPKDAKLVGAPGSGLCSESNPEGCYEQECQIKNPTPSSNLSPISLSNFKKCKFWTGDGPSWPPSSSPEAVKTALSKIDSATTPHKGNKDICKWLEEGPAPATQNKQNESNSLTCWETMLDFDVNSQKWGVIKENKSLKLSQEYTDGKPCYKSGSQPTPSSTLCVKKPYYYGFYKPGYNKGDMAGVGQTGICKNCYWSDDSRCQRNWNESQSSCCVARPGWEASGTPRSTASPTVNDPFDPFAHIWGGPLWTPQRGRRRDGGGLTDVTEPHLAQPGAAGWKQTGGYCKWDRQNKFRPGGYTSSGANICAGWENNSDILGTAKPGQYYNGNYIGCNYIAVGDATGGNNCENNGCELYGVGYDIDRNRKSEKSVIGMTNDCLNKSCTKATSGKYCCKGGDPALPDNWYDLCGCSFCKKDNSVCSPSALTCNVASTGIACPMAFGNDQYNTEPKQCVDFEPRFCGPVPGNSEIILK